MTSKRKEENYVPNVAYKELFKAKGVDWIIEHMQCSRAHVNISAKAETIHKTNEAFAKALLEAHVNRDTSITMLVRCSQADRDRIANVLTALGTKVTML